MPGLFGYKQNPKTTEMFARMSAGERFGQAVGNANQSQMARDAAAVALERQQRMDDLNTRYKEAQMANYNRGPQMTGSQALWNQQTKDLNPEELKEAIRQALFLTPKPLSPVVTKVGDVPASFDRGEGRLTPLTLDGRVIDAKTVGDNLGKIKRLGLEVDTDVLGTPGEKAVDNAFAQTYVDWRVKGGSSDAMSQLDKLSEVMTSLDTENVTGKGIGMTPDFLLNIFNQKAINTRDLVEEVVQRNLRLVLGAQFAEEEGKRLIARAYNPNLDESANKRRVARLIKQMKVAIDAKNSSSDYYAKNGTLRGWTGPSQVEMQNAMRNLDFGDDTPVQSSSQPTIRFDAQGNPING